MSTEGDPAPAPVVEAPKATGSRRDRSMLGAARIVACILSFLGVVGLLRVGGAKVASDTTHELAGLTVAPGTAIAWLVIGLAGVACAVEAARARLYLICAGAVLVLWSLIGLVSGGATDFFNDDPANLALQLVLGAGGLAVALGPTPAVVEKALALPDAEADPEADQKA